MATRTGRAPRSAATVLIVEDDYATRKLYRDALVAAGYEAIAVGDGIGALLYLESHPAPDAVVLNLLLPRVPARVVYEDLRSRKTTRSTPLVIVTGTDGQPFEPDEYVTVLRKPLDGNTLVAAVAAALGETPSPPTA
jgi:DNA-binding response OmpR family regulator